VTPVAVDELYNLSINFTFLDTNTFCPKKKFPASVLPWLMIVPIWMI
jgi:hypothetical protein